ncbi:MAG: hypothetical protein IJA10_10195 [Lachnospiraceae bacterium]|nr:hypothetical protein [Lachnospiraceae bacterium]
MKNEIILTNKYNTTSNGTPFPKTPRSDVRYDGVFPTKEQIIEYMKKKIKRLL